MIDVTYINKLVSTREIEKLAAYMKDNNLELTEDGKIVANKSLVKSTYEYWDKRQLVKKILLNSALNLSALI